MIRQAISCDICGTEKRQTNHWFVAYEHDGELRISAWGVQKRFRGSTRHLCGQTCLHKLVDDFMARSVAARTQVSAALETSSETFLTDASLTSVAACDELESSARLLTPSVPALAGRNQPSPISFSAGLARIAPEPATSPPFETPRFASRSWHAEAWERERVREMRAAANHSEVARRRSNG